MSNTEKEPIFAALARKDMLGNHELKQTHLFASLFGMQQVLKKFLGIKEMPFVHNNDVKIMLRNKDHTIAQYPFSYVSVNSIAISDINQMDPTRIARHSVGHTVLAANATVSKHYFIPVNLKVEMHYVTNDSMDAMKFILKALMLVGAKKFTFKLRTGHVEGFVTITPETKELQLPRADKDNEQEPDAHDIVFSLTMETWSGVSRETAKVNNLGVIELETDVAVDVDPETGELIGSGYGEVTQIQTGDINEKQHI